MTSLFQIDCHRRRVGDAFRCGDARGYGLWFVGYMLLLGRLYYLVTEGGRWTKDFQSIFAKYDAKLKALTEAQNDKEN